MCLKTIDSFCLSQYILSKAGAMNHLKLQKLLYYIEAYHLAYFDGKSLIKDEFEAWVHGPVSRKIWNKYKSIANVYDEVNLTATEKKAVDTVVKSSLAPEQLDFVNDILAEFGGKSSYYLECLTHDELPWLKARKGYDVADKCEKIISKKDMKTFYYNKLYASKKKAIAS